MEQINDKISIKVHKTPFGKKTIKFDFGKIFKALTKSAISCIGTLYAVPPLNFTDSIKELVEVFSGSVEEDAPSKAYELILIALYSSMHQLALESAVNFDAEIMENVAEDEKFIDQDVAELMSREFSIDTDFFEKPKEISILPAFQDLLEKWLLRFGTNPKQAISIKNRLPAYFVLELHNEWRSSSAKYTILREALETPFTKATKRALSWERYEAYLQKQVDEPVFDEAFSLKQIFIPLRAYCTLPTPTENETEETAYFKQQKEAKSNRTVFYLQDKLDAWLNDVKNNPKADTLKLLSGGPGSGKSSFVKMWASYLAEHKDFYVLYFPLHHFNVKDDLIESIGDALIRPKYFDTNPLQDMEEDRPYILLFDGLDELTQQGTMGNEAAKNFYEHLENSLGQFNSNYQQKIRVVALVAGRELSIQAQESQHRKREQVFHLLPYFLPKEEYQNNEEYKDIYNILSKDQRNEWWQRYSEAKGLAYQEMPENLRNRNLDEITAQPLLNYLVALSVERNKIVFNQETNLNDVYDDLINSVYERRYEGKNRTHKTLIGLDIDKDKFKRLLEEIAISAWHGGDARVTTVERIKKRIEESNLSKIMEVFQKDAEKGILRLLTAFYFRQKGLDVQDGSKTFEFTHKSFGEYLVARRLVRFLELMSKQLANAEEGEENSWNENECLKRWYRIAHQNRLDVKTHHFIRWEIKRYKIEQVEKWQKDLDRLFGYSLRKGFSEDRLKDSYKNETNLITNAEENLLLLRLVCAETTKKTAPIDWGETSNLIKWLERSKNQGDSPSPRHLNNIFFNNFICKNAYFRIVFFTNSILEKSSFENMYFSDCIFEDSIIVNSRFKNNYFNLGRFDNSKLSKVTYLKNIFNQTSFSGSSLKNTDFKLCSLTNVDFSQATLENSSFSGSSLIDVDFSNTKLVNIDFNGTTFKDVNLHNAQFINPQGLTIDQLKNCKAIHIDMGLPDDLVEIIKRDYAHLLISNTDDLF